MRVGFTVTKKIGGAVVRNRMKRRFRALAREIMPAKGIAGADHVMIGRAKGIERDFRSCDPSSPERSTGCAAVIGRLMILVARGWQKGPSQVLPPSCRYQPSCSAYAITAIERYGAARGGWMALKRILRCHPWGGQGPDPVPERNREQVNDTKNLILAVVLSVARAARLDVVREPLFPDGQSAEHEDRQRQAAAGSAAAVAAERSTPKARRSVSAALRPARASPSARPRSAARSISRAREIDDLLLLKQRQTIASGFAAGAAAFAARRSRRSYIAEFGWTAEGAQAPTLDTMWTADSQELSPGQPVTLATQMPDGTTYQIKIAVDEGYLFTVQQSVLNGSGKPLTIRPTGLVSRGGQSADRSMWTNHVGPIGVFDGKADYSVNWKDLDEGKAENFNNTGWLGFTDKYWLTALVPTGGTSSEFRKSPSGGYQADYAVAPTSVAPGQTLTTGCAVICRREG